LIDIYPDGHQLAIDNAQENISACDDFDLRPFRRREFTCQILGISYGADQLALPSVGTECHHATGSAAWPARRQGVVAELDLTNSALRAVATIAQVAIRVDRVVGFISSNLPRSTIRPYGGSAFRDTLLKLFRINIVRNGAQSSRAEKDTRVSPAFQFYFRLECEVFQLSVENQPSGACVVAVDVPYRWMFNRGLPHDRTVFNAPHILGTIPPVKGAAIEYLLPALMVIEIVRKLRLRLTRLTRGARTSLGSPRRLGEPDCLTVHHGCDCRRDCQKRRG
jgi:hypothetical protein